MKIVFFCMVLASAFVFAACEDKPAAPADAATNAVKAATAPATPAAAAAAVTNAVK